MIKKPGTAEWELERIGAPERTPQPESNPSFVPAAEAMFQVPLGLRRRRRRIGWTPDPSEPPSFFPPGMEAEP